jgi:hypothetical protein
MSDALLSRLRNRWGQDLHMLCDEAADRIEALEARVAALEKALWNYIGGPGGKPPIRG